MDHINDFGQGPHPVVAQVDQAMKVEGFEGC
jgi:hypothetical protein